MVYTLQRVDGWHRLPEAPKRALRIVQYPFQWYHGIGNICCVWGRVQPQRQRILQLRMQGWPKWATLVVNVRGRSYVCAVARNEGYGGDHSEKVALLKFQGLRRSRRVAQADLFTERAPCQACRNLIPHYVAHVFFHSVYVDSDTIWDPVEGRFQARRSGSDSREAVRRLRGTYHEPDPGVVDRN